MGKPFLPDINQLIQMGINPKTGLPYKLGGLRCTTKEDIKKTLRIVDEQDAVNRYVWYNLPCNITSQELERMIYYKGQLAFFYMKDLDEFYFMPYALDGGLDFYGRFNKIHPIPFNSGSDSDAKLAKTATDLLSELKLNCVYGIKLPEDLKPEDLTNSAVLLHDYTKQLGQNVLPRVTLNDAILDVESDCIPFMRTALLMGTGIKGVRVQDADQEASVSEGARNMTQAALQCQPYIPIVGAVEFQELTNGKVTNAQDYLLAMQAIENLRLSTYGIDNGGLFEKKAHTLQSEADINGGPVGLVLQDGLSIRQNFCNIVNSIWNLGIWCEPAENIIGADTDGDGLVYDRNEDAAQSGAETEEGDSYDE